MANKTKDKFFSVISHDLRGPIGNTKGLLESITDDAETFTVSEMSKLLKIAAKELGKTFNLLENLLVWARSQFGTLNCSPQQLELHALVKETVEPLIMTAQNKELTITQDIKDPDTTYADKGMLSFIIRNLVSNAIKFTHEKGKIAIAGHEKENKYHITITDDGVGMSETQQKDILKIGKSNSTKGTNNEPGTGLRLVLCKEFADINKIEIKVNSASGKGTSFTLLIPKDS